MKQEVKLTVKMLTFLMALLILIVSLPVTAFAEAISEATEADTSTENISVDNDTESESTSTEIFVLQEDEALREENIKHFKLSDGTTKAVVYTQAVHYKDADGKWVDIDNALTLNGSEYSSNNKSQIKFANKSGSSGLVSIKDGDYKIDFTPLNTNKVSVSIENPQSNNSRKFEDLSVLNNLVSKAVYTNIYDGIDIEYVLVGNNIKENIIVKEKQNSYTYAFELKLNKLSAELVNGAIILSDYDSGEQVYEIPAPYMLDASNEYSNSVEYTLVQNSKWKYTLTVTANPEWINAEEREFPVTIDPTIATQKSSITDITVASGNAQIAYNRLITGYYNAQNYTKSFLKFNDLPTVPASTHIVDVKLSLFSYNLSSSTVGVYEATSDWTTGLTYENSNGYYNSSKPLDYVQIINGVSSHFTLFDITNLYYRWLNGTSNNGVCLDIIEFEETKTSAWFRSSENSAGCVPTLEITYVSTAGIEDYYSYYGSSAQKAGTGYVNAFTGNLTFVHNIFSTADEILPYNLYLTYNSNLKDWRLSTEETVVAQTINNIQHYKWTDSDGTEHWFSPIIERDTKGNYVFYEYDDLGNKVQVTETPIRFYDQEGLGLTLTINTGNYVISDDKGNTKTFVNGNLASIKDTYGNERTFTNTNGNVIKTSLIPKDKSAIEQLTLTYSDTLITVSNLQTGVTIEITYTSNLISSVKYNLRNGGIYTVVFGYSSSGLLTSATDNYYMVKVSYSYDTNDRVMQMNSYTISDGQEYAGDSAMITYSHLSTQCTPIVGGEDDITTVYEFDYSGKITTAYSFDENGVIYGTSSYEYNDQYKDGDVSTKAHNTLESVLSLSANTVNLLENVDFEDGLTNWIASDSNIYRDTTNTANYDKPLNYGDSLYVERTSAGTSTVKQKVNLLPGKYVFSASFLRTFLPNSAIVNLKVYKGSAIIASTTHESYDDAIRAWNREFLDFEATTQGEYTVSIELTTITASRQYMYIDNVMLEKGNGLGAFSFYPNGSMESSLNTTNALNAERTTAQKVDGSYSLELTPSLTNEAYYKYTYNVCGGIVSEDLIISAWVKAEEAIASTNTNGKAQLGIKLVTHYTDTLMTDERIIDVNTGNGNWQYVCELISQEPLGVGPSGGRISSIDIYLMYNYNVGSAYFDKITLSRGAKKIEYLYNSMGYVEKEADLSGNTLEYQYASNKVDLIKITDQNGNTVDMEYDENRNIESSAYASEDTEVENVYERNDYGQITSTTLSATGSTKIVLASTTYVEDAANNNFSKISTQTNGNGETTTYYYYNNGLLSGIKASDNSGVIYNYNQYGELICVLLAEYNESSGALEVCSPEKSISYEYNENHSLLIISSSSTEYSFEYDEYHRVNKIKAGDRILATYDYVSNSGDISVMTYGNGAYVAYTYDALDRVIAVCYNGVEAVEYVYSSNGNITLIKDNSNNTEYKYYYSADGVLLNEKVVEDGVASYSRFYQYDDNGQLIKKDVYYAATGAVTVYYTYNKDGSITKIDDTIFAIDYGYDEFGRLSTINVDGDVSTSIISKTYTYADTDTRVSTRISNELMYANGLTYNTSYTYDANGNISSIVKNNKSVSYEYDLSGQLIRENNQSLGYTYLYYYDESGNLRYKETREYTLEATSVIEQTMPLTFELYTVDSDRGDLRTGYTLSSVTQQANLASGNTTYDSIGNPLTYYNGKTYNFTWSDGRRLATAIVDGETYTYKYNQDGIRIEKTGGGYTHKYILEGTKIARELIYSTSTDHLLFDQLYHYDAHGYPSHARIIAYSGDDYQTETIYRFSFITNIQGDVVAIADNEGYCLIDFTYDAWGQCTTMRSPVEEESYLQIAGNLPFRYRGYYMDEETGFYYLNARYYDPQVKRFINADSQLNTSLGIYGLNQFSYCLNNPVNMADYGGNKPGDLFDTIDEAARDFAEYINAKSIEENREYASYIYTKTVTETRTTTYINPNIFGNNPLSWLWNVIFGGGLTITVTTKVKVTKYTYREPKRGTVDRSYPPINWFGIHTVVGCLHTHAAYDPAYASDIFSSADKKNAERQGVPTYVATPLGTLRKYDPSNGTDIVLFNDIPFDPNHPER